MSRTRSGTRSGARNCGGGVMHSISTTVDSPMETAQAVVRASLGEQGFGVLTEIDVAATLQAKMGVERGRFGDRACSLKFAHRALQLDPSVALLLPCNVVLELERCGTRIASLTPRELITDPAFRELANEAADQLVAALAALGGSDSETIAVVRHRGTVSENPVPNWACLRSRAARRRWPTRRSASGSALR